MTSYYKMMEWWFTVLDELPVMTTAAADLKFILHFTNKTTLELENALHSNAMRSIKNRDPKHARIYLTWYWEYICNI